ncbi:hypothetical protein UlMin_037637 [Ulmus minor]
MLKFLSRVKIDFNALDPRTTSFMEFLPVIISDDELQQPAPGTNDKTAEDLSKI